MAGLIINWRAVLSANFSGKGRGEEARRRAERNGALRTYRQQNVRTWDVLMVERCSSIRQHSSSSLRGRAWRMHEARRRRRWPSRRPLANLQSSVVTPAVFLHVRLRGLILGIFDCSSASVVVRAAAYRPPSSHNGGDRGETSEQNRYLAEFSNSASTVCVLSPVV